MDLFSGIGGFALAAKWCGIKTIGFCETDEFCKKVLHKNFPHIINYGDVKLFGGIDLKIDLLTGGFPCQPFSIAGKKRGIKDDRYLWPEFLRIIREFKPTWIIAENVTGIVEMALDNILSELEIENYATETFILPACSANAPHRRDRLWIIANANSERCKIRSDYAVFSDMEKKFNWDLQKAHKEWHEFQPESWSSYTANDWFTYNAGICRGTDGIPNYMDRLKSLGNSIVPQVVYPLMKCIFEIERLK